MNDPLTTNPLEERVKETITKYIGHWRRVGPDDLIARCPFHDDNDPSFSMSLRTGLWLCFSCGEQGTFYQFLEKLGLSRDEIRRKYGRTIQALKHNAPAPPDPTKPQVVMEANKHLPEDLLGLFHSCPVALLEEGFEEAVLEHFEVGVDTTHKRITYPLRDLKGHLVGISGRAMDEDTEPRYKVYDEHEYKAWDLPPFRTDKSQLLWNAHRVYPRMLQAKAAEVPIDQPPTRLLNSTSPVVVVEGFKACMWVTQAGCDDVVALMTKSMSWTQRWLLQRMGGNYILWLDHDKAGMDGIISICKELRTVSSRVRLVECSAKQPTDVPITEVLGWIQSAPDYNEILIP